MFGIFLLVVVEMCQWLFTFTGLNMTGISSSSNNNNNNNNSKPIRSPSIFQAHARYLKI